MKIQISASIDGEVFTELEKYSKSNGIVKTSVVVNEILAKGLLHIKKCESNRNK